VTEQPRTHYQLTFTARQAVGGFVALLVSLGLAFYFGLMSGLSGRGAPIGPEEAEKTADAGGVPASSAGDDTEALPPIETAVPTAAVPGGPLGSRTLLAGGAPQTPVPAEPTAPATLQTFQDGSADATEVESPPAAVAEAPGASSPAPAKPPASASAAGKFWVQVASLSSREEAGSLSTRLTRRGFRSQILTAAGPKGKGKVYRVRVGPYRSEDDAERAATKLARQEHVKSPWVVPDGM
jgi:cell division septation protein DedD